jgi:peptidoglycan/LPS O-acetylase OafA/YrhL
MARDPALDGIRAIAIIAVIGFHVRAPGFNAGFLGVDVFFVLSGYLISRLWFLEGRPPGTANLMTFYRRRFWRLAPALLVLLALYVTIGRAVWEGPGYLREALFAALYVSDYAIAATGILGNLSHTWSLAVEAQFYAVCPLLLLTVSKWSAERRLLLLFGLYAIGTMSRVAAVAIGLSWVSVYYSAHTHASGLFLGCALATACEAEWLRQRDLGWLGPIGLALWMAIVPCAVFGDEPTLIVWISAAEIGTASVIVGLVSEKDGRMRRLLTAGPLPAIGLVSYSLYLWHYPLARIWRDDTHWLVTALMVIPLSFACAFLSYVMIEKPINRWRKALPPDSEPCPSAVCRD